MFAPTKPWRRWHRRINVNQKRYAIVSAIAASGVPALVQSKGKTSSISFSHSDRGRCDDTILVRVADLPLITTPNTDVLSIT